MSLVVQSSLRAFGYHCSRLNFQASSYAQESLSASLEMIEFLELCLSFSMRSSSAAWRSWAASSPFLGREGGRESERVTRGWGACECACGQVAVRVRVRVHMQESARTRTCCRRCVRVFVLCKCACLCGGKACGHVHARAEQRQVLIPHGVERHHAARGRVGERKRVGGGCDGSCYANSTAMRRLVLRDQGAPKYCSENKNYGTKLSNLFSWSAFRNARSSLWSGSRVELGQWSKNLWSASRVEWVTRIVEFYLTLNIPGPIRRGKKRSKLCVRLNKKTKNGRQGPIGAVELGEPARP